MRSFHGWGVFSFLFLIILSACSGGVQGRPVPLPVPFAGALDSTSRVVVADGNPVGGNTSLSLAIKSQAQSECSTFQVFNSQGVLSGTCEYCPTTDLVSTELPEGRRDQYTLPATCRLCNLDDGECDPDNSNDIETVSADLECFDYPHSDPVLDPLIPDGSELRRGVCSGVITSGTRSFSQSVDAALMDGRFAAFSRNENGVKRFDEMIKWNWIIHRVGEVAFGDSLVTGNRILANLFEDFEVGSDKFTTTPIEGCVPRDDLPPDVAAAECFVSSGPLYCEGQDPFSDELPCGRFEELNVRFDLFGELETKSSTLTICKGISCVTTFNTIGIRSEIPNVTLPDIPGGRAFSVTITEHDPVLCRHVTGDFREAACAGMEDDDPANIELDYRCEHATGPEGFPILQTLGSAFIVSVPVN